MANLIAVYLNMNCMKVLKETPAIKLLIKSSLIAILMLSLSVRSQAQDKLIFPFQGGITIMQRFFKDSLTVSPGIIQKRAAGTVTFKFTADQSGIIKNIIIFYADDILLTPPLIEALRKSSHQWIIPDNEKLHDFIITFSVNFNPPVTGNGATAAAYYKFYKQRNPIISSDQVPLGSATLLPTVMVNYDISK
jgi:hypothetical protein